MGSYKALLIGASDYEMHGLQSLPFIPEDLARLKAVLRTHGFQRVDVHSKPANNGKQITANVINGRVTDFLRRSSPGDTLLIMLSGHGVHARGTDYLVPEDIDAGIDPFESGCVAIDWRHHLDETPAAHIVILIDACREGIDQDSMGVASVKGWGRQKISAALRRKVAYVYACSPAQFSLFVQDHERVRDGKEHGIAPGESFSLFSRSVTDVVARLPQGFALSLDDFKAQVEHRVGELHRAYGKRGEPQAIRVVTDIAQDDFYFLPLPPRPQGDGLKPGDTLTAGHSVSSANGAFKFTYQVDGDLVLYRNSDGLPLWQAGTEGRPVGVCIMMGDGNLVIYDAGAQAIWTSETAGNPGSRLTVQDDGNVVIRRADATPAWTTDTARHAVPTRPAEEQERQAPPRPEPATMSGPRQQPAAAPGAVHENSGDDWFSRLYEDEYTEARGPLDPSGSQTEGPTGPRPQSEAAPRSPRSPGRISRMLRVLHSWWKESAQRRAASHAQKPSTVSLLSAFWLPQSPVRTTIAAVFMLGTTWSALGVATTGFTAGRTHRPGPPIAGLVLYAVVVSMAVIILWVVALVISALLTFVVGPMDTRDHPRQESSQDIVALAALINVPATLGILIVGLTDPEWLGHLNFWGQRFAHAVGMF
jgi:hypothetical protein